MTFQKGCTTATKIKKTTTNTFDQFVCLHIAQLYPTASN